MSFTCHWSTSPSRSMFPVAVAVYAAGVPTPTSEAPDVVTVFSGVVVPIPALLMLFLLRVVLWPAAASSVRNDGLEHREGVRGEARYPNSCALATVCAQSAQGRLRSLQVTLSLLPSKEGFDRRTSPRGGRLGPPVLSRAHWRAGWESLIPVL